MPVPSLSWYNDRFYKYRLLKKRRVFASHTEHERIGCLGRINRQIGLHAEQAAFFIAELFSCLFPKPVLVK